MPKRLACAQHCYLLSSEHLCCFVGCCRGWAWQHWATGATSTTSSSKAPRRCPAPTSSWAVGAPSRQMTSPLLTRQLSPPAPACEVSLGPPEGSCLRSVQPLPAHATAVRSLCNSLLEVIPGHLHARPGRSVCTLPHARAHADAEATLKQQQESAAKLAQDFDGVHRSEPPRLRAWHGDGAHKADQAPFHEEELALPRQQDQAASASASVRPATPLGVPLVAHKLALQSWWHWVAASAGLWLQVKAHKCPGAAGLAVHGQPGDPIGCAPLDGGASHA